MKGIFRKWAAKLTEPDEYEVMAWSDVFQMWTVWASLGTGVAWMFAPELRYGLVVLTAVLLALDVWLGLYDRGQRRQRAAAKAAEEAGDGG